MDLQLWASTLGSVAVVSLTSLLGVVALSRDRAWLDRLVGYLVSLAAGVLLGGAVLHLVPEAVEAMGAGLSLSLWVLAGFLGFFLLERFLWTHHHGRPEEEASMAELQPTRDRLHPVVAMNLIGDGVHNFIDGGVIAAAWTADPGLGLVTTAAVLAHEVPQEIGDFGILIFGGLPVRKALLFNFLSACTSVLGAVGTLLLGRTFQGFTVALLPITAGSFLYIAAADLIPHIHHHHASLRDSLGHIATLFGGVALMLVLRLVSGGL